MKKVMGVLGMCGMVTAAGLVFAGDKECPTPPAPTDARFVAITKLAGDWQCDFDGDGTMDGTANFRVTSGGHAVLETMFPGTDHEMLTIYGMDHGKLRVTHYCTMGNAPSMVATAGDAKHIAFDFDSGANVTARSGNYMGGLTLDLKDADHYDATWTHYEAGKKVDPVKFSWSRKK